MPDVLKSTIERLIRLLETRPEADRDAIALARLSLELSEPKVGDERPPTEVPDMGAAQEEVRRLQVDLFLERRLLRIIREERDDLAVKTGQLLDRAQRSERLLMRARTSDGLLREITGEGDRSALQDR